MSMLKLIEVAKFFKVMDLACQLVTQISECEAGDTSGLSASPAVASLDLTKWIVVLKWKVGALGLGAVLLFTTVLYVGVKLVMANMCKDVIGTSLVAWMCAGKTTELA